MTQRSQFFHAEFFDLTAAFKRVFALTGKSSNFLLDIKMALGRNIASKWQWTVQLLEHHQYGVYH